MQTNQLAGHRHPILFMKATHKKQVYIPAFTRHDGKVVKGHMKFVHVTDDHDEAKVASGAGSHSQKIAHGKLAAHAWFQSMPVEHKAALVMAHATDHQDTDSANARASVLRSKILKGEKPIGSEWKAWGYVDDAKRQKLYTEIADAGKGAFFQGCMADPKATAAIHEGMAAKKQRIEHQETEDAAAPAAAQAEEKPAPVAEAPAAPEAAPAPAKEPEPAAPVAAAHKPLDHGELNVPGKTNNIDAQLDKHKKEQAAQAAADAKEATAQKKSDKEQAKAIYADIGPAMVAQLGAAMKAAGKGDVKVVKEILEDLIKWQPAKFLTMAEKWQKEQATAAAAAHAADPAVIAEKKAAVQAAKDAATAAADGAQPGDELDADAVNKLPPGSVLQLYHEGKPNVQALIAGGAVYFAKKNGKEWQKNPLTPSQYGSFVGGDYFKHGLPKLVSKGHAGWLTPAQSEMAKQLLSSEHMAGAKAQAWPGSKQHTIVIGPSDKGNFLWIDANGAWGAGFAEGQKKILAGGTMVDLDLDASKPIEPQPGFTGAAPAAAEEPKAAEPAAAAPAAPGKLAMPEFEAGQNSLEVKTHYENVAAKVMMAAASGKLFTLQNMVKPEKGNTWKGKTANSKKLLALHAEALQAAKGTLPEVPALIAHSYNVKPAKSMLEAAQNGDWSAAEAIAGQYKGSLDFYSYSSELLAHKPDASAAAEPAAAAESGPKEGDTKAAADGGTLVLKDGHWIKQGEEPTADEAKMQAALDKYSDAYGADFKQVNGAIIGELAAVAGQLKNFNKWGALFTHAMKNGQEQAQLTMLAQDFLPILEKHGYPKPYTQGMADAMKELKDTVSPAPAAEPAAAAAQPGAKPAPQHVLDAIQGAKLADSNVNAKPTNAKLQAIHDHAAAGDAKALLHMGFGVNTYGKLAAKLTNQALEAMGVSHKVAHGQKMGTHPGLADMVTASTHAPDMSKKPAEMNISPEPEAAAPAPEAKPAAPSIKQHLLEVENQATMQGKSGLETMPIVNAAAKKWLAENPGQEKELNAELHALGYAPVNGQAPAPAAAPAEPAEPVAPSIAGMSPTATDAMIDAETAFNSLDLGKLQALAENAKGLKSGGFDKVNAYLGDAIAFIQHHSSKESPGLVDHEMPAYDADLVSVKLADELQALAAEGNVVAITEMIATLKADSFDNTAAYGEKLLEALAAKGVTQAPVAPAAPAAVGNAAALAAHEIHAPSFQVDLDGAKQAQKHAAAGNLARLAEHINDLELAGYPHTQKYAQELQAKMQAKLGPAAPAGGSIALTADEIPPIPEDMASAYAKKLEAAAGLAKAGELDALKTFLTTIKGNAPKTQAYIKNLIGKMEAKQAAPAAAGAAQPAAPAITEADLPEMPSLTFSKNEAIAEQLKKLALAGDMQGLMDMQMSDAVQTIGKLSGYAHKLIQALAAKGVGATAAPAAGPKDGDTKQGADGMLVFKDGHWHKVGTDPKQLKKLAASVTVPKFAGINSLKMKKTALGLKQIAEEMGAEGLDKAISYSKPTGKYLNVHGGGHHWKINADSATDNGKLLMKYALALQATMAGTSGSPAVADPAAAGSAAAAKENLAAAPKAAAKPVTGSDVSPSYHKVGDLKAAIADKWEQTGPQKGSNPGGKFKDAKGQEWYCKFPSDPETVKNELLAAKFYQMLGAKVPELRLVMKDGKLGIASKWVDGISKGSAADLAKAPGAHAGFIFDAWLANWDVVGLTNDNLMIGADGKAVRVDVGGSLVYRAQGGKKGDAFGDEVAELGTLLDHGKNSNSAAVFGGISEEAMKEGARQLAKLKPSQIEELVEKAGPGTDAEKKALAAKLIARRAYILKRMKVKDQWDKAPVDESKITVNPADIPDGIDFFKHPEKGGQPLSSKEWLNKQNTLDSANLSAFAKKGDLKALKEYKYQAVDANGNPAGMKPITEHPSNHIQKQWASAVQTLQSIAYPPAETLEMPSFGIGGTIAQIASEVGAFAPHENVTTVAAEHRLGYFMKLAQVDADVPADYAKDKPWKFIKDNDAFVQAGKDNYEKNSPLVKEYISGVQGSGSINHAWSQGATTAAGVGINKLTKAIYDEALEVPENTQLWRWMDDDTAGDIMTKQLIDAPPGTVLQNTDSMCTSFRESWADTTHFCSEPNKAILMRIRCADGAKVTPSYGSGAHWNERELTTLPGARFVVVSVTKGDHRHPNGIVVDCIMLPPDEGFVAQLSSAKPLNKSWSNTECPTHKAQASKVIVLRRMPSRRQANAI